MKYNIIIIGAGPAGLSAAVYGMRAGFSTLVLDPSPISGGQVLNTYEVDNYLGLPGISGFDMGEKFKEHALKAGAKFVSEEVTCIEKITSGKETEGNFLVVTKNETYEADTVIIATGATHSKLGAPGEEKLTGMGVSYCATCDGAFFRNKTVAVVGGGDVAVEDAIFLARACEKVYLIHRRDKLRAAASLAKQAENTPNIEFIWNTTVEEILGEDQVEGLKLLNKDGKHGQIAVQGVFIAVGIRPITELFVPLIKTNEKGYILADESCKTNVEGIFAAGDCRNKRLRQIITAVADGANAISSIEEYMQEK